MLALIGYGLLGLVVAVGVVSLLVIVLPADHLGAAPRDVVPSGLPARPEIRGEDVARVRLPVTLRGYRMVDTDAILDRLAFELERRDQEIDNLRQRAGLPPREFADSAALPSDPLDDRARDEVLLSVGATASGDVGAASGSYGTGDALPAVGSVFRRDDAPDRDTAAPADTADGVDNDLTGAPTDPRNGSAELATGSTVVASGSTGAVGGSTAVASGSTGAVGGSTAAASGSTGAVGGSTELAGGSTDAAGPR